MGTRADTGPAGARLQRRQRDPQAADTAGRALIDAVLADPTTTPTDLRLTLAVIRDVTLYGRTDDTVSADRLAGVARVPLRSFSRSAARLTAAGRVRWEPGCRGRRGRIMLPVPDVSPDTEPGKVATQVATCLKEIKYLDQEQDQELPPYPPAAAVPPPRGPRRQAGGRPSSDETPPPSEVADAVVGLPVDDRHVDVVDCLRDRVRACGSGPRW